MERDEPLTADRPAQARSVATRAALLDAALESLVERGYAATTTIETARRAGVSRGAQLHHFPTKAELLTAAVEHLLERRLAEFRDALAALDPSRDRLDAAVDLLWAMFQGPAFVAWVELWIAARTDPELASVVDRHGRAVHRREPRDVPRDVPARGRRRSDVVRHRPRLRVRADDRRRVATPGAARAAAGGGVPRRAEARASSSCSAEGP